MGWDCVYPHRCETSRNDPGCLKTAFFVPGGRLEWIAYPESGDDEVHKVQEQMGEVRTILSATAVAGWQEEDASHPPGLLDNHTSSIRAVDPRQPLPSSPAQKFHSIDPKAARGRLLRALHHLSLCV
jgi:hypothetical protein